MIELCVCVGSSCHIRGSYQVIKIWGDLIKENKLEDRVVLKAAFCMGQCMNGIACTINGEPVNNVGFVNAYEIFNEKVMPLIAGASLDN